MDSAILMLASKKSFKNLGFLAAKDYFWKNNKTSLVHYFMNLIPVERNVSGRSFNQTIELCRDFTKDQQNCLVIYPEGTRSKDGTIKTFKSGVGMIATTLNLPVVPCFIKGSFESMPKGTFLPKPKMLSLKFGDVLYPVKGQDPRELSAILQNQVEILRDN
jgi:1-acyl-sn-glycerol-3-phosphate acyltransferase